MDYQSNSKNKKEPNDETQTVVPVPPKKIERVVVTDVIIQKPGIGRKFRNLFLEADIKSAARYVVADVLIPAARNLVVDATTKGMERLVYGDRAIRRRNYGSHESRISYNSIPSSRDRGYGGSPLRDAHSRNAPPVLPEPRGRTLQSRDLVFSSREEADLVLEKMNDVIDQYEVVSMADLNDLVGIPSSHTDNKWGWSNLKDVKIHQVREGFLIDFPPAEAI